MSKLESIAQAFATYRQHVIPDNASDVQIEECRRAFYAGSYALLMNVAYNIGDDSTSEEEGVEQLEALKVECETFMRNVGEPQAEMVAEQSSYNVRHPEIEQALRSLATQIKTQVPTGYGFTLLIFSYGQMGLPGEGKAGSMFYISSAQRQDMVQAMKEFIARNMQ